MRTSAWVLVSLASALAVEAAIYESVTELPTLEYDFVIVGGGVGGSVVANRLTEDPSTSVLLLEAGGTNENVLNSIVPFYCSLLLQSQWDWNYTTTPLIHANNQTLSYTRGYILGGSSSINNWNHYARLVEDDGWSWDKIYPYFLKNEKFVKPADNRNITGRFDPSVHSFNGINSVSLAGYPTATDDRVIEVTKELSDEFGFNLDHNTGKQLGIGWLQFTIGGGKRSSAATSYLGPEYIRRPNLDILLHATVARVLPTGFSGDQPIIREVEFRNGNNSTLSKVQAKNEIILSAGSIGTPHILLNSGIGPSPHLTQLGIRALVNLPSVGRNLSDHAGIANIWPVNSTNTWDSFLRNDTAQKLALEEWEKSKTGPLVDGGPSHIGFVRVPEESGIFDEVGDPTPGPDTGHFELEISNGNPYAPPPGSVNTDSLVIASINLNPVSRGSISLNSTNPFAQPLIDLNFLASSPDISILRESIRSARRFVNASVWKDYITGPDIGSDGVDTDEELDAYIRTAVISGGHPVGTASMSPKGADWGVVDPDLKVKGVVGLRIVDASVLPSVPAGHTQAPTYAVGERGADLVKASWRI